MPPANIATVKPVKADTSSTFEAVLARLASLENLLLPIAATVFPVLSPYIPAAAAVTGAASKIVDAIDGVDDVPSAVATMAACTCTPTPEPAVAAAAAAPAAVQPSPDALASTIAAAVVTALQAAGIGNAKAA